MIEDGLFFALGVCVATILGCACLPLLWGRALRLTKARFELLVPWSKQEIDAERDGLRAQSATLQRRLEQDVRASRDKLAARVIELGHRTAHLGRLEAANDALRLERSQLVAELTDLGREMRENEGQRGALEKALHDTDRRIETDAVLMKDQRDRFDRLASVAEERRGSIAALETRVAGLQAKVEDRDDVIAKLRTTVTDGRAAEAALRSELVALIETHAALTKQQDETVQVLGDERARAIERDRRLLQRTEALEAAEARITEQDQRMTGKDDAMAALQSRFDALQARLAARRQSTQAGEDAALRDAVSKTGDEALALLTPKAQDVDPAEPSELVRESP